MTMASPSELSLDCKPHSYSMLLKSFGDTSNTSHHLKLEEHLSRLEEERLKIDAFKRELPLCMQLLSNAVEASRQQLQSYRATSGTQGMKRPILEEFIPMKHSNSEGPQDQLKTPNTTSDKANWMTSAQLWSQADVGATTKQLESLPSQDLEMGFSPKLSLLDENNNNKKQGHGRAFLPFIKERNGISASLPKLALTSDEKEMGEKMGSLMSESELRSDNSAHVSNGIVVIGKAMDTTDQTNGNGSTTTTTTTSNTSQPQRKQRRCWSPDLHRRFVNALQMLGGSQVATPKQIRELMKVDGLTNDEVKSHLQKYRLHTRRPGPSPQGSGAHGPQLVVLGGIWVPPEYATAAAHHHGVPQPTMYSGQAIPQVGPHYCPPGFPHEFYPSPLSQVAQPQAHHHHQVHFYKASSQGKSSPDWSESIEDGKSESGSGEESNKKLGSKREGEEESNGSDHEIILKF